MSLYSPRVGLNTSKVSLHSPRVSLYPSKVSLGSIRVNLHSSSVSTQFVAIVAIGFRKHYAKSESVANLMMFIDLL
jgi:hypothetical protein